MTKAEVSEVIHQIIQSVASDPNRSYWREVMRIFDVMGKLSPEPDSGNIRPVVHNYNRHLVKKVGRRKVQTTAEQRAKAKEILRKMGML